MDKKEQQKISKAVNNAMVMCQAGGCVYTEEQKADLEKVKRGEITMEEMEKKLLDKIARLRIEHPEMFASKDDTE